MQDTINIAAVDDLPEDLERLGAALETYAAQHELTIEASGFRSGEELLEAAASGGFDIVFLDIVMDGIDGLETARRLRALGSEALLVFVTTEAGYALEGYEVEAAGFLVKGAGESGQRRFYECHRGIVINLDAVGTLEAQVVVMENGDRLPVSRRRRPSLEQAYAERSIARVRSEL